VQTSEQADDCDETTWEKANMCAYSDAYPGQEEEDAKEEGQEPQMRTRVNSADVVVIKDCGTKKLRITPVVPQGCQPSMARNRKVVKMLRQ
jgi:hypothetical protein